MSHRFCEVVVPWKSTILSTVTTWVLLTKFAGYIVHLMDRLSVVVLTIRGVLVSTAQHSVSNGGDFHDHGLYANT